MVETYHFKTLMIILALSFLYYIYHPNLSLSKVQMNNLINYEILINIKSMSILSIRQSSFYQIRLTVYQTDSKNVFRS